MNRLLVLTKTQNSQTFEEADTPFRLLEFHSVDDIKNFLDEEGYEDKDVFLIDSRHAKWDVSDWITEVRLTIGKYRPLFLLCERGELEKLPDYLEKGADDFLLAPLDYESLNARQ